VREFRVPSGETRFLRVRALAESSPRRLETPASQAETQSP
jgi:hypothetical protein